MSVLGCCSRPNGIIQRTYRFACEKVSESLDAFSEYKNRAVAFVAQRILEVNQVAEPVIHEYRLAAQQGYDNIIQERDAVIDHIQGAVAGLRLEYRERIQTIQQQSELARKAIRIVKIAAVVFFLACLSCVLVLNAQLMAQEPFWKNLVLAVNAIGTGMLTVDSAKIIKNISSIVNTPLLSAQIAINRDYKFWKDSNIFSGTFIQEMPYFYHFKNIVLS